MKEEIIDKIYNIRQEVLGRTNRLLSLVRHRKFRYKNYSVGACVFVAAVTLLPSLCQSTL
jgi:hypothetical protein